MLFVCSKIFWVCWSALLLDFNNAYGILEPVLEPYNLFSRLDRQFRPCYAERIPAVLCSTRKYQSSSPSNDSLANSVCAISQIGERRQELLTVVADGVLRRHGPEIDHIRIVPIEDKPGLG